MILAALLVLTLSGLALGVVTGVLVAEAVRASTEADRV